MRSVFLQIENPINVQRLQRLQEISGPGPVLILTHNFPDPDSLASGMALAELLSIKWQISSRLIYSGVVARAENRAMLRLLTPGWEYQEQVSNYEEYSSIALVDTQPGAGNNSFPSNQTPQIVIDHHNPIRDLSHIVPFSDIRPEVGATVTLLYQYYAAAEIVPDAIMATAMFYGLHTDTLGLARGTSTADEIVYFNLLGLLDRNKLVQVEQAGLSREYFQAYCAGLGAAWVFGKAVVSDLGAMHRPDLAGEMADVLIRLDEAQAVLCMGTHHQVLYFSIRTKSLEKDAGTMAQALAIGFGKAGGHGSISGGQIPLDNQQVSSLAAILRQRFLGVMEEDIAGIPLLENRDL